MSEPSVNLLETILGDESLRAQLDAMPADEKTIALGSDGDPAGFIHPDWRDGRHGQVSETVLLPLGDDGEASGSRLAEADQHEAGADRTRTSGSLKTDGHSPRSGANGSQQGDCRDQASAAEGARLEGFLPIRRIASLSEGKACDADYRMVGELGSGGTGKVFQAHQRAIDREVALKKLHDNLAKDAPSRLRFLTEARVIGALDHPNVIALHELCMDSAGSLFYSMKRVDGTSWDQRIGEMSIRDNLETLLRVADAIRYAHSRGLIHRDLKPENVMLGRFGEVLVADWGLALSHRPPGDASPTDSAIGGTPAYMAPELASGDPNAISFQSDIYLLGAILFQILTGHPPHSGRSLLDCIRAAARNEIRPTRVTGELMEIASRAMATDPAERFSTVDAFIAALQDQRSHEQSVRLVERAQKQLGDASPEDRYEAFRLADALIREALDLWPENEKARRVLVELQLKFARAATSQGDYDLALSLYEAADEGDSEAAQRVRHEKAEREANLQRHVKYSTLFTESPEAGLLVRLETAEVVEANEAFVALLGYAAQEIVGRQITTLNVWACPERRQDFVEALNRNGAIDNFEAPFQHRDGRRIAVLISARKAKLGGEEMLISTIRDISQRKAAETELKRSRTRLRELQRMANLGTWSYDVATNQVTWSEETFRLLRRDPDAGPPTFDEYLAGIHPDDRELMRRTIRGSLQNGTAYDLRVRHRVDGVGYRRFMARGQPVFDETGATVELYGVVLPDDSSSTPSGGDAGRAGTE